MHRALAERARLLVSLLLLGQGLLVVTRVLDHSAPLTVGWLLIATGGALLAWHLHARAPTVPGAGGGGGPRLTRAAVARAIGASAAGGVVAYNGLTAWHLAPPELAIVAYGVLLVVAAGHLHRRVLGAPVGTLVAYSFPLALAPLGLWALNGLLEAQAGSTPLTLYIRHGLVAPMAWILGAGGLDVSTMGETVRVATPRGALFLTVGVVCAGLYAGVIFMGVFGLFAWDARTPPRRLAAYLALGLAGLHLANVLRLALLGYVGHRWGGVALQEVHRHAGWLLFLLWTVAFWWLVLRHFEGPGRREANAS